jgi:hypothetical protein
VEIEKQELDEQRLVLLEKTLEMWEKSHSVRHVEITTTRRVINSWENRLQEVECHLDKMGL